MFCALILEDHQRMAHSAQPTLAMLGGAMETSVMTFVLHKPCDLFC